MNKDEKRAFAQAVGRTLVRDYGQKDYYTPEEVKKSAKRTTIDPDLTGAMFDIMALFVSHEDYDALYEEVENTPGYLEAKADMLQTISVTTPAELMSAPEVNLDDSIFDIGEMASGLTEGIGDFISSILEIVSD